MSYKDLYQLRKKMGYCPVCGKERFPGDPHILCVTCRDKAAARQRNRKIIPNQKPVFVYGTLMRGYGNNALLAGCVSKYQEAVAPGHRVYGVAYFPGMVASENPDEMVHGELVTLKPTLYDRTMTRLDQLEGYHDTRPAQFCMYLRKEITVELSDGTKVQAWAYIWNRNIDPKTLIASGRWEGHRKGAF